MGYLDAIVANTFRTDRDGRRVFVRSRRRAYLVSDEQAAAFVRFQRWYLAIMFVAVPLSAFLFRSVIAIGVVSGIWLVGWYLKLARFTRGLEPAPEIPALRREEAIARATAAMGSRTIAAVGMIAGVFAVAGGWLLATRTRSVPVLFLTIYAAAVAVLYGVRWRQQRRREAAT